MIELDEQTRSRWMWILAAVTAAYGLANVLVFFTTGSFGPVWFAAGMLVYSVLLVSALTLSLLDPGRPEPEVVEAEAEAEPEAREQTALAGELLDHETLYTTRTGRVVRARFGANGHERSLLFAVSGDEVLPVTELEERLDGIAGEPEPLEEVLEVEEALADREGRTEPIEPDPSSLAVDIVDHETLYHDGEAAVVRVRYRAGEEEHTRLFGVTEDEVVPIDEVEGELDTLRVDEIPVEVESVFEEMLARGGEAGEPEPGIEQGVVQQ